MIYRGYEIKRTKTGMYQCEGHKRTFPTLEGVKAYIRGLTEKHQTRDRRLGMGARKPKRK